MPNPNKFKDKSHWMSECMHQNFHIEHKDIDQSKAICLDRWRKKKLALDVVSKYLKRDMILYWKSPSTGHEWPVGVFAPNESGHYLEVVRQEKNRMKKESSFEDMPMVEIPISGTHSVPVCKNCIEGSHLTYGGDHRKIEDEYRSDCKNVGILHNKKLQCGCRKGWPELEKAIEHYKKPIQKIFDEYKDLGNVPIGSWPKDRLEKFQQQIREFNEKSRGNLKTADYPKHPDSIVIRKGQFAKRNIQEIDIFNYYTDGIVNKMIPELKGQNLFIGMVLEGNKGTQPSVGKSKAIKPMYIRHPYDKKTEFIRIGNSKQFEEYHSGRTVEFHRTSGEMVSWYIIDFDAPGPFSKTKKIVAEIADKLDKLPEVKNTELHFTGKRGFHIFANLKKSKDINSARNFLKGWLQENFGNRDDVVIGESPSGEKGALGLSPMKLNGGHIAPWSMRVTGLCCVKVPRAQLISFEREDASLEKVYKKLTGKTFQWGKQSKEAMAKNIVVSLYPDLMEKVRAYEEEKKSLSVVYGYINHDAIEIKRF